jgi:hypothetical protein
VARVQRDRYVGGEDRPLKGYVATMAVYAGLVSTLAATADHQAEHPGVGIADGCGAVRSGHPQEQVAAWARSPGVGGGPRWLPLS